MPSHLQQRQKMQISCLYPKCQGLLTQEDSCHTKTKNVPNEEQNRHVEDAKDESTQQETEGRIEKEKTITASKAKEA